MFDHRGTPVPRARKERLFDHNVVMPFCNFLQKKAYSHDARLHYCLFAAIPHAFRVSSYSSTRSQPLRPHVATVSAATGANRK
jgi:hypothetical protein